MKSLTKVVTGMSVATLSIMLAGAVNADAAGKLNTDKTISSIAAGESVSFDAVKNGKINLKAKWDLYEAAVASKVDASCLKTAKDSYVTFKTTGTDGKSAYNVFKITKDTLKQFKATCDGTALKIIADGTELKATDAAVKKYEWRTENSEKWTQFSQGSGDNAVLLDLTPYTMQGATLYIRYRGTDGTAAAALEGTASTETIESDDGGTVTVKEIATDAFVKKEFKVKVPKKANAPTISVDYAKGIIKKNTKISYKAASDKDVAGLLSDSSAKWAAMESDYSIPVAKKGAFLAQVPATSKKAASKIAAFQWNASDAITVTSNHTPTIASDAITNAKGDIIAGELTYEMKDNADAAKTTYEITNTAKAKTFEIYTGKGTGTDITYSAKPLATLKPGKTVKLKSSQVPTDAKLYIRVSGDKKTATLPSQFSGAVTPAFLATPAK